MFLHINGKNNEALYNTNLIQSLRYERAEQRVYVQWEGILSSVDGVTPQAWASIAAQLQAHHNLAEPV